MREYVNGVAACQKGYSVAFTSAASLVHEVMEARDEKRLRALHKQLPNVKVLIADELGYVPFTAVGAQLLIEVISRRYEQGATLVTSDRPSRSTHHMAALFIKLTNSDRRSQRTLRQYIAV